MTIALSPLLPWIVLAPLIGLAAVFLALAAWRRARGTLWRITAVAVLVVALANPSFVREEREPIDDVAVLLVDDSPSQAAPDRRAQTEAALDALRTALDGEPGLEVRVVRVDRNRSGTIDETRLFGPLADAIADVPRRRMAGIVAVTDGQVHDVASAEALGGIGPVHTLLTGTPDELDRRITVVQAPSFGVVGEDITLSLRVDDLPQPPGGRLVDLTLRWDDGVPVQRRVPVGVETEITIPIDHGGSTVIEAEVPALDGELSLTNNRAVVVVNGVRDRLRVLLVSGEPHQGERTWRNILKSDPGVDLIHFTILRPPEKQDGTPINELSLISFPIRELFELTLSEFDLIIFDRYRRRGVLPLQYLTNIANYVAAGGALLEASGPQFASTFSLYRTPLGQILPGEPTGDILESGFRPAVTEIGRRHPVTADMADRADDWGRWFRLVEVSANDGATVMTGLNGSPLLVLDRVGEGRVAQLTSDQIWLWARGFEGGGPQAELLRRLAHWLMQEPELEEEGLTARVDGTTVTIEARRLGELPQSVTVTAPSGAESVVPLRETAPGRAAATVSVEEPGIIRVNDGERVALAVVGTPNPPELADMRASDALMAPLAAASGGGVFWLDDVDTIPDIRRVAPDRPAEGRNWLGLRRNGDYVVVGIDEVPLLPAAAVALLALATLLAAWRREGR